MICTYSNSANCFFSAQNSVERNRPRVVWPIGFFSRTTTSWISNMALCGWRVHSRIKRLSLFRSTALLANFLATVIPRAPSMPWLRDPKYKPQFFDVLGFVLSNSDMRALFKRASFTLPGVYGLWHDVHLKRCGHHVFSCAHEIRGCVCGGLRMVDMFFSCLTSGKPSIFLCGA